MIKVEQKQLDGDVVQTVNARDLHEFLENKRQFADWIKQRIGQYDFVEDVDFTVHKFVNGKATQIDYFISLNMAKELSMVENNDRGKEARRYFIECEKRALQPQFQLPDFTNPAESARAWAEQFEKRELAEEKVILLENKIEEDKPKLLLAETLLSLEDGDGLIKPKDFAKAIESIYGVGRNTFYQILRDVKIWNKDNIPYARFVQAKYFNIKNNTFYNKYTGQNESNMIIFITPKGRQYLIGKLSSLFDVENI